MHTAYALNISGILEVQKMCVMIRFKQIMIKLTFNGPLIVMMTFIASQRKYFPQCFQKQGRLRNIRLDY